MTGKDLEGLYNDTCYRVRCMRSMAAQIKEDHAELNRLWKGLENSPIDKYHEEESLRLISWLKGGLNLFKELRQRGIEGVCWGEIDAIEKDIQNKERILGLNRDCFTEKIPFPL